MLFPALLVIGLLSLAAAIAAVAWWFGSAGVRTLPEADWLRTFSAVRYRPMLRMLAEDDYRWLAAQGLDPQSIRRLRSERRKIFGTYLQNLVRDFDRLHTAARMLLLAAPEDRPDLAARLVTVRIQFQRALLRVRFQLLLHDLGFRNVDVSGLVSGIEAMHKDLRTLLPSSSQAFSAA
jgi:hypothetical protein